MSTTWWQTALSAPAGGEVLAMVTTIQCAIAALVRHKSRRIAGAGGVMLPSVMLVVSPWLLPSAAWQIAAIVAHVGWLVACERLLRSVAERREPGRQRAVMPSSAAAISPGKETKPSGTRDFVSTPVLAILVETSEIRTFRVARPPGFEFSAGQFVMVRVDVDGRPLVRCYSISSSPATRGYLEISVRRQGQVSGFLHATLQPGSLLDIRGPNGTFVYPEGKRPILLIAAGIGITPLLSMLRHALDCEPQRPVTLLLSARTEQQVPFLRELQLLASRHPMLRLAIALSRSPHGDGYYPGRIDRVLIETVAADVRESVCLLCGPLPMIDDMVRTLSDLGVARERIRFEKFEAATATAKALATDRRGTPRGESLCLKLRKRGRVVTITNGQSILEALESAGEKLPSFCRAGVCGTCKTRVFNGEVEGEFDAVDDDERANGFVLACVARPVTDCEIDV